ncbi:MAG: hypothetical protein AB4426_08070 [Xenococcaceae cyanobacterium]
MDKSHLYLTRFEPKLWLLLRLFGELVAKLWLLYQLVTVHGGDRACDRLT